MVGKEIIVRWEIKMNNNKNNDDNRDPTNCWWDGICNDCGWSVIERPADDEKHDYKNRCSNASCSNSKWHYIVDDQELDYYIHN